MQNDHTSSSSQLKRHPPKSSRWALEAVSAQKACRSVPDIVQFACGDYYCMEGDTHVEVKIERLGNPDGSAQVEYFTVDGSAIAGIKYKSLQGVAKFAPQQTECLIRIELIEDNNFDSVLEFQVELKNPVGASLDNYLHKCEITVADDDCFPTNRYRDSILSGDYRSIAPSSMMKEYLRMHMQDKKLWHASLKTFFSDQVENLDVIWNLLLMRYLIDNVLTAREGPAAWPFAFLVHFDVHIQIWFILGCMLLPSPLRWMLEQRKGNRRMGGKARMRLQKNLLRKFMNYSELSRSLLSNADITMAITRDVPQLVRDGLLVLFPIMQKMSLLIMYGVMAIRTRPLTGTFFVSFPVLMLCFLKFRLKGTEVATMKLYKSQTKLVSFMQKATDYFRMIADYRQKQETVDTFGTLVQEVNDNNHAYHARQITNHAFAPFLSTVIVGVYILMFYQKVRDPAGGMGVGDFVTGIGVWRGVGSCYQGIYEHLLTMEDALSCFYNVLYYMNLPLDICDRAESKTCLLQELDKAQDASSALFYRGEPCECSLVQTHTKIISGDIVEEAHYSQDLIQIDCQNVSYAWPPQAHVKEKCILQDASFEVSQGQLVGLIGGPGSGKATLLQLLGGVIVPKQGSGLLFVPPHLRLLHITCEPVLFHDCTMWENLLYGEVGEDDASPQRIVQICQRLGMSEEVLDYVKEKRTSCIGQTQHNFGGSEASAHMGTGESVVNRQRTEEKAIGLSAIPHRDRVLLHYARALIVNPDVLILHKPITHFHGVDIQRILEVFREFVDLRGLEKEVEKRATRRPRTCIMSLASLEAIEVHDTILQIREGKVHEVNMTAVEELQRGSRQLVSALDANGDGYISKDEFVLEIARKRELFKLFEIPESALTGGPEEVKKELALAFDKIDFNQCGSISTEELTESLQQRIQDHLETIGQPQGGHYRHGQEVGANGALNGTLGGAGWERQTTEPPDEGTASLDTLSRRLAGIPLDATSLSFGPGFKSSFNASPPPSPVKSVGAMGGLYSCSS